MLTIQTFLLKFRKNLLCKDLKTNAKYASLIFVYTFVAVVAVLKFNVFRFGADQETRETFATQNITKLSEGTNVLSEVEYMNVTLNSATPLKQQWNTNPMTLWALGNTTVNMSSFENVKDQAGQVTFISADIYTGDLVSDSETKKEIKKTEKVASKTEKKAASTETVTAKSEKTSTEAKETMKTVTNALALSAKEIDILQRIVEAEATGEDIKGKMLVANVIINRVRDAAFPDSVEGVVFQKTGRTYQFSPISDKRYYSVKISNQTKEAVQRVLQGEDYSQGALYFSARKRASATNMKWFDTNLKWLFQYGNHEFFTHK